MNATLKRVLRITKRRKTDRPLILSPRDYYNATRGIIKAAGYQPPGLQFFRVNNIYIERRK